MPNKRSKDQTQIAFALHGELLRGLDQGREMKGETRSDFVRVAIINELARRKIAIPMGLARAPDRSRKARYPENPAANPAVSADYVNLMPDPNLDPAVKAAADRIEAMAAEAARAKKRTKRTRPETA